MLDRAGVDFRNFAHNLGRIAIYLWLSSAQSTDRAFLVPGKPFDTFLNFFEVVINEFYGFGFLISKII